MGVQEEKAASRDFTLALIEKLGATASSPKELEIVVEQIVPVLVPAIVHLLKAVEAREEEDEDVGDQRPPIRPLDHLARFLYRRNPHHTEPTSDMAELQTLVRKLLQK